MHKYKSAVAAQILGLALSGSVSADTSADARTETMLQELAEAESEAIAKRLEQRVIRHWSNSGSAAIDLLLKRGRDALEVDNVDVALGHLTALTDHAPNFAEGWHTLAMAYFRAEMFGPAADALERTLALNPRHFGAMRGLAAIFEQTDKPALAYDLYGQVLELRPHDSDIKTARKRLERRVTGTSL